MNYAKSSAQNSLSLRTQRLNVVFAFISCLFPNSLCQLYRQLCSSSYVFASSKFIDILSPIVSDKMKKLDNVCFYQ